MNANTEKAFLRYMAAHVQANSKYQLDLSGLDILGMFALLKPPVREFPEWCEIVGEDLGDTEDERISDNETTKNMLVALGVGEVTEEIPEETEE